MANPADMMKMISMFREFQARHPKIVAFMQNEVISGVPEGSVFEVSMTKPGAETMTTNLKITKEDLELFEQMKKMR